MVFEPWRALADHLPPLDREYWSKKLHLNFILYHYIYMVGWAIVGTFILYPLRNLHYIDALFFTAGAATQSGLNTVDVNKLALYQQITLMIMAHVCNPIWINTAVVFVRLHWFQRKFKGLTQEANEKRRTKARTFTKAKSENKGEIDPSRLESGVAGKKIQVLHDTVKPNGMSGSTAKTADAERIFQEKMGLDHHSISVSPSPPGGSNRSSDTSDEMAKDDKADKQDPETPAATYLGLPARLSREITFADEVPTPRSQHAQQSPNLNPVPEGQGVDKHIQFIERQQQNAKRDSGTLRIPGPRDFDRGEMPQELDDSDNELQRPQTRNTLPPPGNEIERARRVSSADRDEEMNLDDHAPHRAITIAEPDHPGHRTRMSEDTQQDAGPSGGFLSKVRSGISHRRNHSGNLKITNARSSVARTFSTLATARSNPKNMDPMPYLSWQATIGRNSAFVGLSEEQREELGGVEYRALKTLAKILIGYFVGFHLSAVLAFLPWIMTQDSKKAILRGNVPYSDGDTFDPPITPSWWGVFTAASMFNDLGFTLTPNSMVSFQTSVWPLLYGSFLIIIGNTGFPVMLRFVIWVVSKCVATGSPLWEELRFLLDHPRRCFTLLFPSKATWWLFWVLVILNGVDLLFFVVLDLNGTPVTGLSAGFKILDGWFQATSTRTAGFSCVNLAELHPAIQVSYLIMMYISVFPIAISLRRTNVYEEKSLGVWGGEDEAGEGGEQSYVGQHLRRQLGFDLWYVFLGFFIICIVEGGRLAIQTGTDAGSFTMFAVLFEIVSAYGTVGLSMGYPTNNASFSGQFHTLSKLVIIAMMIRGRHRGLPYTLDRAILLPSEKLHEKDAEAAALGRRQSIVDRHGPWDDEELDDDGFPLHSPGTHTTNTAMTAGAGGEQSPEGMRRVRRRSSGLTTTSRASGREGPNGQVPRRKHERRRSIGLLMQGLNPGPTISKHD